MKPEPAYRVDGRNVDANSLALIGTQWQALEQQGNKNFFLSWPWIETWLTTIKPAATCITAYAGDQVVAMGLVVASRQRRHKILFSRALHLHQTGLKDEDQIWIEYDDFLIDDAHRAAVYPALMDFLYRDIPDWDEFIVGLAEPETLEAMQSNGLIHHMIWEEPTYSVNLATLRETGEPFLNSLSSNTRSQIRRAQKKWQKLGDVQLTRPQTTDEAMTCFEAMADFHHQRWGDDSSGFANPKFLAFHRQLIQRYWQAGYVDLVSVSAGEQVIAHLYFFVYKNQASFYLSAIDFDIKAAPKPGLVAHALCIEDYLGRGELLYDFMGGEYQYKRSLSNQSGSLACVSLQKPKFRFRLELFARRLQRRMKKTA